MIHMTRNNIYDDINGIQLTIYIKFEVHKSDWNKNEME